MECPYCETELSYHDRYGRFCDHQDGKKLGDIYKCENEESQCYGTHFYTRGESDELHEGYPC